MNEVERDGIRAQGPEPVQRILAVPRGFINVTHSGLASESGNGFIVRQDGRGDAINHLLQRPQAHGDMQNAMAKVLDEASGAAVHASELAHQGDQTRPITGLMGAWHLGFEGASTATTGALMKEEMLDVHLDRWQFKHLMGVVGLE